MHQAHASNTCIIVARAARVRRCGSARVAVARSRLVASNAAVLKCGTVGVYKQTWWRQGRACIQFMHCASCLPAESK